MKTDKESETLIYISSSKLNIDNFLRNNEYKKAFALLIVLLERLVDEDKTKVVNYYSKSMQWWGF